MYHRSAQDSPCVAVVNMDPSGYPPASLPPHVHNHPSSASPPYYKQQTSPSSASSASSHVHHHHHHHHAHPSTPTSPPSSYQQSSAPYARPGLAPHPSVSPRSYVPAPSYAPSLSRPHSQPSPYPSYPAQPRSRGVREGPMYGSEAAWSADREEAMYDEAYDDARLHRHQQQHSERIDYSVDRPPHRQPQPHPHPHPRDDLPYDARHHHRDSHNDDASSYTYYSSDPPPVIALGPPSHPPRVPQYAVGPPTSPPFAPYGELAEAMSPPLPPPSPFSSSSSPSSSASSPPALQYLPLPPGADVHYAPMPGPSDSPSMAAIVVTMKPEPVSPLAAPAPPPPPPPSRQRPSSPRSRSYSQTDVPSYGRAPHYPQVPVHPHAPSDSSTPSILTSPTAHYAHSTSRYPPSHLQAMQERLHALQTDILRERQHPTPDAHVIARKLQEAKDLSRTIVHEQMSAAPPPVPREDHSAMYDDSSSSGSGSSPHSHSGSMEQHEGNGLVKLEAGAGRRPAWPHGQPSSSSPTSYHGHLSYHSGHVGYGRHGEAASSPSYSSPIAVPSTRSTPSPPGTSGSRYAPFPGQFHPPPPPSSRSNKRTRSRSEGYSADAHVPGLPPHLGAPRVGAVGVGESSRAPMHWHTEVGELRGLRVVQEHEQHEHDDEVRPEPLRVSVPVYHPPPPPPVDGAGGMRGLRTFSAPNTAIVLDGSDRHYVSAPSTPVLSPPWSSHSHSTCSSPVHTRVIIRPRSSSSAGTGMAPVLASPARRAVDGRADSPSMDVGVPDRHVMATASSHASPTAGAVSSPQFRSPVHRPSFTFRAQSQSPRHHDGGHPVMPPVKMEPSPPMQPPASPQVQLMAAQQPTGYVVASTLPLQAQPLTYSISSSEEDESLEHPSPLVASHSSSLPLQPYQLYSTTPPTTSASLPSSPTPPLPPAKKARKKRRKSKDLPENERWYCPLACGKYLPPHVVALHQRAHEELPEARRGLGGEAGGGGGGGQVGGAGDGYGGTCR